MVAASFIKRTLFRSLLLLIFILPASTFASNSVVTLSSINQQFTVNNSLERIELWQRQHISLLIEVDTEHEFSYLDIDKSDSTDFIIEYTRLNHLSKKNDKYIKSYRIDIWPLSSGYLSLKLKPMYLMLSARKTAIIEIPAVKLAVKPLPSYLPPDIPVGKITASYQSAADFLLPFMYTTQQISESKIVLSTRHLHSNFVPKYHKKLAAKYISILSYDTIKNKNKDNALYTSNYEMRIKHKFKRSGLLEFDPVRIIYFDPEFSKINSFYVQPSTMLVLPKLLWICLILLSLILSFYLGKTFVRRLVSIHHRRRLWTLIIQSNNLAELTNKAVQLTNGHYQASSITDWANHWQSSELIAITDTISFYLYGPENKHPVDQNTANSLKLSLISSLKKLENPVYYFATG